MYYRTGWLFLEINVKWLLLYRGLNLISQFFILAKQSQIAG